MWPAIAALMSNCASVFFYRYCTIASWSYACFSKGRGRSESNTVIFHDFSLEPPPSPPKLPGHFGAVLEADGHGLKSCQVSRQSVFIISKSHQNPIMFPGSDER